MKGTAFLILIFAFACVLMPAPVSAIIYHEDMVDLNQTITFADLGLSGQQDVQIWVGNTLVEAGNTSGADTLYQPLGDYTTVVKPSLSNRWLNNPALLLTDGVDYLLAFALPLFIILGFAAILVGLAHIGRRR